MSDERGRMLSAKEILKDVELARRLSPELDHERPQTREACVKGARPCPFISCKYHLYLDVSKSTGAIKLNFPELEVEDMRVSCALDVADHGGATLEEVGSFMNLTRERARQIETSALIQLRKKLDKGELPLLRGGED